MPSTVRLLILGAFVLGMPLLALPQVLGVLTGQTTAEAPLPMDIEAGPPRSEPPAPSPPAPTAPRATAADPFPTEESRRRSAAAQERLKVLGASVFTLQYLPGQEPPFLAYCEVDLPQSPALRKEFEVRGAEPLEAVLAVLDQVEQWHVRISRTGAARR